MAGEEYEMEYSTAKLPPNDYMKQLTIGDAVGTLKYTAFDEATGMPTSSHDGKPLTADQMKSAKKEIKEQEKKYEKYLKEQGKEQERAAREASAALSPLEYMKQMNLDTTGTLKYSQFDEATGMPTHFHDGQPLTKDDLKKARKELDEHAKIHKKVKDNELKNLVKAKELEEKEARVAQREAVAQLTALEYMKQLIDEVTGTPKYSQFDESTGMPTHLHGGQPLGKDDMKKAKKELEEHGKIQGKYKKNKIKGLVKEKELEEKRRKYVVSTGEVSQEQDIVVQAQAVDLEKEDEIHVPPAADVVTE
eukprot:CAMPEP_0184863376 /NCGR_PEP_ID=MMETSP0580-20130426/10840_1 /TAXON_ID=1118495 /ORGANISM="Dactyliosolen fragilissimus" /LENGTH=305 /DNA_ID=CAMNT_0027361681 /DNA_START=24 /DNA_END=941 /DNA_ORIENTATION=+